MGRAISKPHGFALRVKVLALHAALRSLAIVRAMVNFLGSLIFCTIQLPAVARPSRSGDAASVDTAFPSASLPHQVLQVRNSNPGT
jgi:hypothetical protein